MPTITPTITEIGPRRDGSIYRIVWASVTENDTCAPANMPGYADKSIQAFGTFGGATVALHGSNDNNVTYTALHDPGGTAIGLTAAGIRAVLENTEFFKPVMSGGTGQSLTLAMVVRLSNTMRQ